MILHSFCAMVLRIGQIFPVAPAVGFETGCHSANPNERELAQGNGLDATGGG
jgi:hypothetical protein